MGLLKSLLVVGAGAAGAAVVYAIGRAATAQAREKLPTAGEAARVVARKIEDIYEAQKESAKQTIEGAKRIMGRIKELAAKIATLSYFRRKPSDKLLALVADAAVRYDIPVDLLLAVIYNESGFSESIPNFRQEKESFATQLKRNTTIPGTNQKWTDVYPIEKWGSGGPTQTLIYNVVGKPGGLKPGEWFDKLTLEMSVDLGARELRRCYDAASDKPDALRWYYAVARYNGTGIKTLTGYVIHVAAHLNALGAAATLLTPEAIAAIRTNLAKAQADPKWKKDASTWASQFNKITGVSAVAGADVGPTQDENPRDAEDALRDKLQAAYLARDLDAVAALQDELAALTDIADDNDTANADADAENREQIA